MTTYSIYLPPASAKSREFKLLADGVSVFALIVPLIWLLWNRLWLELLAYLVIVSVLALTAPYLSPIITVLLSSLPALFLFLEGRNLICSRYERKGWSFAGVVEAETLEDAEFKLLHKPDGSRVNPPLPAQHSPGSSSRPSTRMPTGLFPE